MFRTILRPYHVNGVSVLASSVAEALRISAAPGHEASPLTVRSATAPKIARPVVDFS